MTSPNFKPRRVVVTGVGVISPIGNDKEAVWDSLINGRGGVGPITRFDASDFAVRIAAEVKDFDPKVYIERREARHMDLFAQFGLAAGIQAVEDSCIDFELCDRDRSGVIIGSGIGGLCTFEEQVEKLLKRGPSRVSPFFIPMMIADIVAGHLSIRYDLRGPNYATTSACATSSHSIGCAMKAIRYGDADLMLSGGCEAPITKMGLAGFAALKAISSRNDEPEKASRPFDAKRDGFIIGEGSGVILLEELEHALARKAKIYCEIVGVGFTGDAYHITAPAEDGHGAVRAMQIAIKEAGLTPDQIGYVNAHGTSTSLNDKAESQAIRTVFGVYADQLSISSTKSMHGHLLGAAGAIELIVSMLAMNGEMIPPTINYEYPDPECDLNYTPNSAVKKKFDTAMSNTFGFGGHNASIVIRRYNQS
ncbi:MAG: beta-ketoacyl-ACP synthase II [Candidatus Electryoneaceae bacterium]|nr:beta-ketoacyl-ACP synthase II [Candidatus Electryoneaceae bacterium]